MHVCPGGVGLYCPTGLAGWLAVSISISLPIYLPTSTHTPPPRLSIIYYLPIRSIRLSIHPSIYLPSHPLPSVHPSTYLPICLSVCLSVCPLGFFGGGSYFRPGLLTVDEMGSHLRYVTLRIGWLIGLIISFYLLGWMDGWFGSSCVCNDTYISIQVSEVTINV